MTFFSHFIKIDKSRINFKFILDITYNFWKALLILGFNFIDMRLYLTHRWINSNCLLIFRSRTSILSFTHEFAFPLPKHRITFITTSFLLNKSRPHRWYIPTFPLTIHGVTFIRIYLVVDKTLHWRSSLVVFTSRGSHYVLEDFDFVYGTFNDLIAVVPFT